MLFSRLQVRVHGAVTTPEEMLTQRRVCVFLLCRRDGGLTRGRWWMPSSCEYLAWAPSRMRANSAAAREERDCMYLAKHRLETLMLQR